MNSHNTFASFFTSIPNERTLLYLLSKKMNEGNVCLNLELIDKYINEEEDEVLTPIDKYSTLEKLNQKLFIVDQEEKAIDKYSPIPFVINNKKLYTQRYFSYETKFINGIKSIINSEKTNERIQSVVKSSPIVSLIKKLFPENNVGIDWQFIACLNSFVRRFSIITGGPGTGKTTTVSKLLELFLLENPDINIKIAAPTGKAASRLKDSMAEEYYGIDIKKNDAIKTIEPTTIHKLLGSNTSSIIPKYNKDNKLECDLLIIDESSMIDIALFTRIIEAIDTSKTMLILLGDRNQLASVDAGSLFGDMCESLSKLNEFDQKTIDYFGKFLPDISLTLQANNHEKHPLFQHIIELQKSYRNSGGISEFSSAVIKSNTIAALEVLDSDTNIKLIDINDTNEVQHQINQYIDKLQSGYHQYDNINNSLSQINNYKILCAIRKGRLGVKSINQQINAAFNSTKTINYHNQLIMVTRNEPVLHLANGDIGIVRAEEFGNYKVYFPIYENEIQIPLSAIPSNISSWEEAYAMTIHKSQGSEFEEVIIIIPDIGTDNNFMTRELLYTAVTRAKKHVAIISSKEILSRIIIQSVDRVSGIKERW